MNIPDKVIDLIEKANPETGAIVYYAILLYMRTEEEPSIEMAPDAGRLYIEARGILDPILRRRKRQAEYRRRRKMMCGIREKVTQAPAEINAPEKPKAVPSASAETTALSQQECKPIPLTRQQRRRLERINAKLLMKSKDVKRLCQPHFDVPQFVQKRQPSR